MSDLDSDWLAPGSEFLTTGRDLLAKSLLTGSIAVAPGIETIGAVPWEGFEPRENQSCLATPLGVNDHQSSLPGVASVRRLSQHLSNHSRQIQSHMQSMLENAKMPNSWVEEGIEEPTDDCKYYTLTLLSRLNVEFGLIPYKVAVSKEGGMFAAYRRVDNGNIMRVEIDNELDAVAVVSDGSRILDSGILESDDLEKGIVDAFNGSTALAIEVYSSAEVEILAG